MDGNLATGTEDQKDLGGPQRVCQESDEVQHHTLLNQIGAMKIIGMPSISILQSERGKSFMGGRQSSSLTQPTSVSSEHPLHRLEDVWS